MPNRIVKKVKNSKFISRFPRLSAGTLVVMFICTFMLITATFTPIPQLILAIPQEALIKPSVFFAEIDSIEKITRIFYYIPQIPIVLMIAAMLGPRIGIVPILMYIAAGLSGVPVFAGGGGLSYFAQPWFGYILGFIPGVYTSGNILSGRSKPFSVFRAALVGVIFIHITGIIYLIFALLFKCESIFAVFGWIWQLSGIQLFYDMIFGIIAVFAGRFLRKILWVATD